MKGEKRKIYVDGVWFDSIRALARATGISVKTWEKPIYQGQELDVWLRKYLKKAASKNVVSGLSGSSE